MSTNSPRKQHVCHLNSFTGWSRVISNECLQKKEAIRNFRKTAVEKKDFALHGINLDTCGKSGQLMFVISMKINKETNLYIYIYYRE